MKVKLDKKWWVLAFLFLLFLSAAMLWRKWFYTTGMEIHCATTLHYDHAEPDFIATLEMNFRLDKNYEGLVILSGVIETKTGEQIIARNITFDYDVKKQGEVNVRNMVYKKMRRDTANDDYWATSFFYVPEGTSRQLQLTYIGNAWLIGNQYSPVALCVNK